MQKKMLTREEIVEIVQYCKENGVSYVASGECRIDLTEMSFLENQSVDKIFNPSSNTRYLNLNPKISVNPSSILPLILAK